MTKVYCDHCGEIILLPPNKSKHFTLPDKDGEAITPVSDCWEITITMERNLIKDSCQHCLDDVMERAFRLFLETRSTKRG